MSGDEKERPPVLRYDRDGIAPVEHRPVREFPLSLTVNGVDLATLIASPHDLRYLVAGFLRTQGMVEKAEDILAMSVCPDSGAAHVQIRGKVPSRLKPILTSGCGTGITFRVPAPVRAKGMPGEPSGPLLSPEDISRMMDDLAERSERYREHRGIHSAAAGDARSILLHAEDIGRHNTVDRIAGEALLREIDLEGKILLTSGRVSSEMAAKAAMLGIAMVVSRTSPTDLAVRICEESGITLVGYARGERFNVYSHPCRIAAAPGRRRIAGVACVILAGGSSRRMGSDKALLPYRGGRFIETIHRGMAALFEEVLVVTNSPEALDFLPCRKVPDLIPGMGALSGIHSGLRHSEAPRVFAVACDMPFLDASLIRHMVSGAEGCDVVVPEGPAGLEPLHAVYSRTALGPMEEALRAGEGRIVSFFDRVRVRKVGREEVARFDPEFRSFRNINTPEDYFRFREAGRPGRPAKRGGRRTGGAES